jgi:5-methyltetrahydropteroyltriglutamate--homocysteine methyltransferase
LSAATEKGRHPVDRILTTHVGSLIRPESILPSLLAMERGEPVDQAAFGATLKGVVADVVRRQVETGLDIVDDGEMGKPGWITYSYERIGGIEPIVVHGREEVLVPAGQPEDDLSPSQLYTDVHRKNEDDDEGVTWRCTGPLTYDPTLVERDIANLEAALEGKDVVDGFIPAVAPGSMYWIRNEHYATDEEFVFAFADVLHEEYKRIVDAGFLVSVDDAVMWHKLATIRVSGGTYEDYVAWAEPRIEALNHALRGIPADRVRYHLCSGSGHTPHTQDPELHEIIELVLRVNARYLEVEQGNARHEHEWSVWEDVPLPDDKVVVPGVVTHQTMMVEHPKLVMQRLVRLANLVGRDRVQAGTDCGFAQDGPTRRVPEFTQWAKLRSLVEGARLASEKLWP